MNDMSAVIVPKSDQLNAEDFLAGPRTYTIEVVEIRAGTEQPVNIKLVGEPRAWRPCKSMSRVLVSAWGPDANVYIGRSVTLYNDPKVKWGGMEVGGIRVSHMSHIDRDMLLQLTATKGKRAPHLVKPLAGTPAQNKPAEDGATRWANAYLKAVGGAETTADLNAFANSKATKLAELEGARADLHKCCVEALDRRRKELSPASGFDDDFGDSADGDPFANDGTLADDNPTAQEGPADEQMGEANITANEPPYLAGIREIRKKLAAAATLKAVEAIAREWDNTLRVTVEESDNGLMLSVDRDINARRRELRAGQEG